MPCYEFYCVSCDRTYEAIVKMDYKDVPPCPQCKSLKGKKLISHSAFHLKGGCWEKDGYASKKPQTSNTAASI